jgi:hAT family C-terminal dimerisation region
MDFLLSRLEKEKVRRHDTDSPLRQCIELAWEKLDIYYSLTDRCPVHLVAIILDPRRKMKYFEKKWATRRDWIQSAKAKVVEFWGDYQTVPAPDDAPIDPELQAEESVEMSLDDWVFSDLSHKDGNDEYNELEEYLNAPILSVRLMNGEKDTDGKSFDILMWWKGNESIYPSLSRMAFDILSIPAMSTEAERIFSGYVPL